MRSLRLIHKNPEEGLFHHPLPGLQLPVHFLYHRITDLHIPVLRLQRFFLSAHCLSANVSGTRFTELCKLCTFAAFIVQRFHFSTGCFVFKNLFEDRSKVPCKGEQYSIRCVLAHIYMIAYAESARLLRKSELLPEMLLPCPYI